MKDFISEDARERLIRTNADASGDVGALAIKITELPRIQQCSVIRAVIDSSCMIRPEDIMNE